MRLHPPRQSDPPFCTGGYPREAPSAPPKRSAFLYRRISADIRHGWQILTITGTHFQVLQSQHARISNCVKVHRGLAAYLPQNVHLYFPTMNPSNRKRLRKNKAKSCSDNSQSSGEEVLHSGASEAKENRHIDAEDLSGGGKPSAKTYGILEN